MLRLLFFYSSYILIFSNELINCSSLCFLGNDWRPSLYCGGKITLAARQNRRRQITVATSRGKKGRSWFRANNKDIRILRLCSNNREIRIMSRAFRFRVNKIVLIKEMLKGKASSIFVTYRFIMTSFMFSRVTKKMPMNAHQLMTPQQIKYRLLFIQISWLSRSRVWIDTPLKSLSGSFIRTKSILTSKVNKQFKLPTSQTADVICKAAMFCPLFIISYGRCSRWALHEVIRVILLFTSDEHGATNDVMKLIMDVYNLAVKVKICWQKCDPGKKLHFSLRVIFLRLVLRNVADFFPYSLN